MARNDASHLIIAIDGIQRWWGELDMLIASRGGGTKNRSAVGRREKEAFVRDVQKIEA